VAKEDMVTTQDDLTVRASVADGSADAPDLVATFECEPASAEWLATGDVSRGPQGLVISRLEVRWGPTSIGGITGGTLQKVPVGRVLRLVRAEIDPAFSAPTPVADLPIVRQIREGGRVTLDDALFREIAYRYWFYTQPGQPPGAIKRMAADFGRPDETIRTWVARARKAGWLGPSVKGRAGAEAGPKLKEVFEIEQQLAAASTPLTEEERTRYFSEG